MNTRYNPLAILLHWAMAFLIIGVLALGFYMVNLQFSPSKMKFINWHKWLGVIALSLFVLRVLTRMLRRPPALPAAMLATMPAWQRAAHTGTHVALYVLMAAVPLAGMAYSSAAGFPVVLFGLWPLPSLVAPNPELALTLKSAHIWAAWALAALVALHVAAALKHQFIERDGLMRRMMPGR